jgi:cytochrome c oxidase cbb3-type subunit 1
MAVHGFIALGLGFALIFVVGGVLEEPVPDASQALRYCDDPIKVGILLSVGCGSPG